MSVHGDGPSTPPSDGDDWDDTDASAIDTAPSSPRPDDAFAGNAWLHELVGPDALAPAVLDGMDFMDELLGAVFFGGNLIIQVNEAFGGLAEVVDDGDDPMDDAGGSTAPAA